MIAIHQIAHCTALQCLVSKNRCRPQVFSWKTPEAWFAFCLFIGDLIISSPTWWEHLRTLTGGQLPQGLGNLLIFAIRFATNPHLVPGWGGGGGGGGLHWLLHYIAVFWLSAARIFSFSRCLLVCWHEINKRSEALRSRSASKYSDSIPWSG